MSAERISPQGWKILIGLTLAQLLGSTGQVTLATLSGLVGTTLTPDPQWATLPVTAGILGVAAAALPAALLIRRYGRKLVYAAGLVWSACGAAVAAWSISSGSFAGFCAGCFMVGNNMPVIAQYRFAAAECVPSSLVSRAVSGVMLGMIGAALLAPWYALRFRDLLSVDFSGSYLMLPLLFLPAVLIILVLPLSSATRTADEDGHEVSLRPLLRQPDIMLAMIAAAAGYGVMSLIMTATPISMHVMDGHSVEDTADVIQAHILAMFVPSLVSGWLIARLGVRRMLWAGLALESICVAIAISGQEIMHYSAALIALGAGWNFLYIGGTTLLTVTCPGAGSKRVQGINEFVIFGTMAVASLSAGALLNLFGWITLQLCAIALLLLIATMLLRTPGAHTPAAAEA